MSENIGINLQAGLNVAQSTTSIKQQIQKIQDLLKPLNIKIDNDKLVKEFDKVSSSIKIATDGTSKIQKNIINITTEEGKLVQITQAYNKEINAMAISQIKVLDNIKAQALAEEKLAIAMGKLNEQSQARAARDDANWNTNQNNAIRAIQAENDLRTRTQQEASATARRMMVEEENQRLATTTNTQRRIEQAILGSNETIAQQQARINSSQTNGYRYEQMFLQASREREALDARTAEAETRQVANQQRQVQLEEQQNAELRRRIALYQEQNAIQLRNIQSQYGSLARTPEIQSQISTVRGTVGNLSSTVLDADGFRTQSAQINTAISGIRASLNEAREASRNFANDLIHNGVKMLEWTVVGAAIFGTLEKIKEGFSFINELDKAMTNISMITGRSRDSVLEMTEAYADLATQLHSTTSEIMKASEEFLRAGHNQEETIELIQSATVMSAIAGQDSKSSADQLIAITNGFKMQADEVMNVVDKLTTVDNMSATSTKELGTALERTSVSAQMAGTSFSELVSYIGTVSSISRKSASSIGESFKTIFSRFQDVRGGKNFDAENQDISNVERDFKKYADISIRETSGEFKDFSVVIDQLSSKWNMLSEVAQSAAAKALAGTRQRENFLILMNNMDTALKLQSAQLDSNGSAMERYGEYAKSTEAKLNDLTNAVQKIWMELISSDAINSAIIGMTSFVNVIGDVISTFGGLNSAIYATIVVLAILKSQAIAGIITSVSQWVVAFGLAETASLGLSMGIRTLSTALLGLAKNPIAIAIVAVGSLTAGLIHYAKQQAEVKKQLEETKNAQESFNTSVKDFQNTLDSKKIDEMATALGNLKTATNYDENIKKINELKDEIASIQDNVSNGSGDVTLLPKLEEQLSDLEDQVQLVTNAQKEYDEQKKIATALDYQSVQTGNQKIALKIRENEANRQLIDSYQKVYDKLAQGNELTQEESDLNQKMIDKYPEYTQVLNDKTTAVGINIEALKDNQSAEEALAIVSFNAMKSKADSSEKETDIIIKNTEARIKAIQAEIDAIEKRDFTKSQSESDAANAANLQLAKLKTLNSAQVAEQLINNTILENTVTPKMHVDLSGELNKLQLAKQTKAAWNTLANMSVDDLRKGVSGSENSFDPPSSSSKSSSKNDPSYTDPTDALLAEANAQANLTAEKEKSIKSAIDQAKSDKDYQKELELTTSLLQNQQIQLEQLSTARSRINSLKDSTLSSSSYQFGDINSWFTDSNEESVDYVQAYNSASKETQETMEKVFTSMQKLRSAWVENNTSITELNSSLSETKSSLQQISFDIVTQQISTFNTSIDRTNSAINISKARMSLLSDTSSEYSQEIIYQTNAYNDLISQQKDSLAYMTQQLDNDNLSIESKADLSKQIDELTTSYLNNQNTLKELLTSDIESKYNKIVDDINKTLEEHSTKLDETLTKSEERIKKYTDNLSNIDYEMSLLQESDYEDKIDSLNDAIDMSSDKANRLASEFNRLSKTTVYSEEDADKLRQQLESLKDELESTNQQTIEYIKSLEQAQFDKITSGAKLAQDEIDRLTSRIDANTKQLDGGILSDSSLSFDFELPDGNTLDLTSVVNDTLDDVEDIEIKIDNSLQNQLDDAEDFQTEMLKLVNNLFETILSSNDLFNTDIENGTETSLDSQLSGYESFYTNLSSLIESSMKNASETQKSYIQEMKDNVDSLNESLSNTSSIASTGSSSSSNSSSNSSSSSSSSTNTNKVKSGGYDSSTGYYWITDKNGVTHTGNGTYEEYEKKYNSYATGTHINGVSSDETAIVSEKGRELIVSKDGKARLTGNKGAELVELKQGDQVIPNPETEELLKHRSYASGTSGYEKLLEILANADTLSINKVVNDYRRTINKKANSNAKDYVYDDWEEDGRTSSSWIPMAKYENGKITDFIEDMSVNQVDEILALVEDGYQFVDEDMKNLFIEGLKNVGSEASQQVTKQTNQLTDSISEILDISNQSYQEVVDTVSKNISDFQSEYDTLNANITEMQTNGSSNEDILGAVENRDYLVEENSFLWNDALLKAKEESAREAIDNLTEYMENNDLTEEMQTQINEEIQSQNDIISQALEQRKQIVNDFFTYQQSLRDEDLQEFTDYQDDIQHYQEMIGETNYDEQVAFSKELVDSENDRLSLLKQQSEELQSQLSSYEVGSYEWNLINEQVEQYGELIEDAESNLVSMNKELLSNQFSSALSEIEETLFNGQTQDEAQEALQDRIDYQEEYASGEEKALKTSQIRYNIQKEINESSSEAEKQKLNTLLNQLAVLESQDEISQASLDSLEKQFAVEQAQAALENVQNQKKIQQMTKTENGWDFTYVADEDEILQAQQNLIDAQLDYLDWQENQQNETDQSALDDKSEYLSKLKDITDNAQNGEYASFDEFQQAMDSLNQQYLNGMLTDTSVNWSAMYSSIEANLGSILTSYSAYVVNLQVLAEQAKQAYQDILDAQSKETAKDNGTTYYDSETGAVVNPTEEMTDYVREQLLSSNSYTTDEILQNVINKFNIKSYGDGGVMDYTGVANVHGTKTSSEVAFNSSQAKKLYELVKSLPEQLDISSMINDAILTVRNISNVFKPVDVLKNISSVLSQTTQTTQQVFNIDRLEFPNIKDGSNVESLISGLKGYALQYSKK